MTNLDEMNCLHHGARTTLHGIDVTHLRSHDGASAVVADHGAHVLSWIPAGGSEALFLSAASQYGNNTAIRGGIPIIFPQFGELGTGRRHGFARVSPWSLMEVGLTEEGAATAQWRLQGSFDPVANPGLCGMYCLELAIRLVADTLEIALTIDNPSTSDWECNAALHTYLHVDDLATSRLYGLEAMPYVNQAQPGAPDLLQAATPLGFAHEVDRIYPNAPTPLQLQDQRRKISVTQNNFKDTVVWNPGIEKARQLHDLQSNGYQCFVCIEAAAVSQPIRLASGMRWHGTQQLQVVTD